MNINVYFEITAGDKTGLTLQINELRVDLRRTSYQGQTMLYYGLKSFSGTKLNIGLTALRGESSVKIYIINASTGKVLVKQVDLPVGQKQSNVLIELRNLLDKEELPHKTNLYKKWPATPPEIKKTTKFKIDRDRTVKNRSVPVPSEPDYSYFEKQNSRDELLSKKFDKVNNVEVEVFFATNRKKKIKSKKRITYTNSRGDLALGKCLVNVPGNRSKGNLPMPKWYLVGSSNDENNFVILKEVNELTPADFFGEIGEKVKLSPEKDAFLFVHGFNVDFTEGVSRAAQIAVDIGFNGAPIVYSWPSRRNLLWYTADEATAGGYSTEDIVQLLKQIRLTGAERIHIIAHSMGNRLITDALQTLVDQGFNKDFLFNQVILAAPDIDAEVFIKRIAPKIVESSERVTLYASAVDIALWFSAGIHGKIQRAGKVTSEIAVADGLDTIDASLETTDLMGHGYFAETKALIDDIFHLIRFNHSPAERNLRKREAGSHIYWEFW